MVKRLNRDAGALVFDGGMSLFFIPQIAAIFSNNQQNQGLTQVRLHYASARRVGRLIFFIFFGPI
jgi:hypothetical protein